MAALEINVLGGFEATDEAGKIVRFHTRKAAALLAYLAMNPGKEFSREHLMNLLWSDRAEAQASNSLRQSLSQLRKALRAGNTLPLLVSPDGISINSQLVSTDAVEFERLAGAECDERHQAVDYYKGEFLADFTVRDNAFEEWRRQKTAQLNALAVETFDGLMSEAVSVKDDDRVTELARGLHKIDPAHEGAHRALMRLHSQKGRRGAALQQYEVCREYLSRELGIEPDPETEETRRSILSGKQRPTEPVSAKPANTLGVLPFTTLDDDIDAQRLSVGLAASIAMELGRFRSLKVVAAAASFSFRNSRIDLSDIADSLDVHYLVEGSVDRSGERLHGFVRLTEPRSGRQIWSDRFNAGAEDVFDVIDKVVHSIVGPVAARVESEEIAAARRKPAVNLDAYEHWLRGLSHLRSVSADDERAAQEHFQAAIELEPDFARAHANLAMAYFNTWSCAAWGEWDESIERCLEAANQALALDPSDHLPHMILAVAHLFKREFDKSRAHRERAIKLNPNDADLLALSSMLLTFYGEPEAGVEAGLAAMKLNPFYTDIHLDQISAAFQMAGRYDETYELLNQMSGPVTGDQSWEVVRHVEIGKLDDAKQIVADFRKEVKGLWPQVSSSNDLREILETINPWQRQEDYDRFFGALDEAGLFGDYQRNVDAPRLTLVR